MKKTCWMPLCCAIALNGAFTHADESLPDPAKAFAHPIVLGPDDKAAFDAPPPGFNAIKDDLGHGKLEMIEYDSKTVGTKRKMQVYTPPRYSKNRKYPVLYLLHGIGGDENEWQRAVNVAAILDSLIDQRKAKPMIVVMPNGRAQKSDRPEGNVFASAPAFATFERDLLDDVIPAIESRYLKDCNIPHVWHVEDHGHDPAHWGSSLHYFLQKLFR